MIPTWLLRNCWLIGVNYNEDVNGTKITIFFPNESTNLKISLSRNNIATRGLYAISWTKKLLAA